MSREAAPEAAPEASPRALVAAGSPGEVFRAFLKLGLTSFGSPIAHIGYFRDELVLKRRWTDEQGFADLVALCQFLPGPASRQLGFALGILRGGGLLGGLAAWAAFTLPSALVLLAFALSASALSGPWAAGALHGLKLVAVSVVAQAVWGMARSLAPHRPRAGIALAAVLLAVFVGGAVGQVEAIVLGAMAGLMLCRSDGVPVTGPLAFPISRLGALLLAAAGLLLMLPPLLAGAAGQGMALFEAFYRSGALVFGGGHVVLPLLEAGGEPGLGEHRELPDRLWPRPGGARPPLHLRRLSRRGDGPGAQWGGRAALTLVAMFLPGLLLVTGMLPFWDALRARPAAQAAMRGANAAVVGILGAALYSPVWTGAILRPADFTLALAGFLLLTRWQAPPALVVALLTGAGVALA